MFLLYLLIIISYYDLKSRRIPLPLLFFGLIKWVIDCFKVIHLQGIGDFIFEYLIEKMIVVFVIMSICILIYKIDQRSIGLGDILMLLLSVVLTSSSLFLLGISITVFLVFTYSVGLISIGHSKRFTLPFAPFFLIGYGIALLIHCWG